jgi:hypothetical protein
MDDTFQNAANGLGVFDNLFDCLLGDAPDQCGAACLGPEGTAFTGEYAHLAEEAADSGLAYVLQAAI